MMHRHGLLDTFLRWHYPDQVLGSAVDRLPSQPGDSKLPHHIGLDQRQYTQHIKKIQILRHALKNALIPTVTVLGIQFGALLGGAVIIETIFAFPGIGTMLLNAVNQRDYPVVQGGTLVVALIFTLTNLLVDILYTWLNPRIRYE